MESERPVPRYQKASEAKQCGAEPDSLHEISQWVLVEGMKLKPTLQWRLQDNTNTKSTVNLPRKTTEQNGAGQRGMS